MDDTIQIADRLRQKLKLKNLNIKNDFASRYKGVHKALSKKGLDPGKLRKHSAKVITAGALAGTLAMNTHLPESVTKQKQIPKTPQDALAIAETLSHPDMPAITKATKLRTALSEILPEEVRPLNIQEEKYLEQVIKQTVGINAKATLEGEHLNTTYGRIGAEQHLVRYPGDTNANHAPKADEYAGDRPQEILKEGMAPGKGAWGYFANSKEELTDDLIETEQWYSVAQTLYLHDWNTRQPYLKNWYKHRKILIINTDNGKAVVTALADSGPAAWTGKHFGGSPEVMDYLGGPRYKKGPVLFFFVDDPENKIPLGPVEYNNL